MAKESKREREQAQPTKAQKSTPAGKRVARAKVQKHKQAERTTGQSHANERKQVERTAGQSRAEEHKQAEPTTGQVHTNKHKQVERTERQGRTRAQRQIERTTGQGRASEEQIERAERQDGTREYKQVERARAQERTREALIEAATDEFFEGNWLKITLDSLSRRAGVTRQTLLRHFGSKDGLLMQSLMRGASQVRDQRWSTPTTDIAGAVENVIDHYEEWGERSVRIGAWQRGPTVLALFANAARQIHYDWVEHAFGQWLERLDDETRARRQAILIVLCDVQTWWILSNDLGLPRREIHAILTDQVERALEEKR